jgi:hypothetical protein
MAAFDWQYVVVGIILLGSILYVLRFLFKSSKGESCASGAACKCEGKVVK